MYYMSKNLSKRQLKKLHATKSENFSKVIKKDFEKIKPKEVELDLHGSTSPIPNFGADLKFKWDSRKRKN